MSRTNAGNKSEKQGFSLVEVALAVLAVGLGLLTIFALFPAGLQMAIDDAADTRAGLFAETVFAKMRGMAAQAADEAAWDAVFNTEEVSVAGLTVKLNSAPQEIKFPQAAAGTPEDYLRYVLSLEEPPRKGIHKIYGARLATCDGRYGGFATQNVFYTEFSYMGM